MMEFVDYISDGVFKCKLVRENSGKIDMEIIFANRQTEAITGKPIEKMLNKRLTDIFPALVNSMFDWPKILSEAAMTTDHKIIEQYVVEIEKYLRFSVFGLEDDCFFVAMQDVTEKKAARRIILEKNREIIHLENQLKLSANVDMLTKLYNLQFVIDSIKNSITSYKEEDVNFCILIIDIDDFNEVNLNHGIDKGDKLLQDVAQILSCVARKIDVVGRYGNDKFIIVLNNVGIDIAKIMAERIKTEIEEYDIDYVNGIKVCGALVEYNGETIEKLIGKAEILMKKAQYMGKGVMLS